MSEEEYRYGIDILQKIFPDTDLNIDTLRELAESINRLQATGVPSAQLIDSPATQPLSERVDNEPGEVSHDTQQPLLDDAEVVGAAKTPPPSDARNSTQENGNILPPQFLNQRKGRQVIDLLGVTSKLFFKPP